MQNIIGSFCSIHLAQALTCLQGLSLVPTGKTPHAPKDPNSSAAQLATSLLQR